MTQFTEVEIKRIFTQRVNIHRDSTKVDDLNCPRCQGSTHLTKFCESRPNFSKIQFFIACDTCLWEFGVFL
ncbi:hypothetical protein C4546_02055 [Candidatus Parcubacteria bacterium]|jgi:C4-type Zn-finger protein|nr:MAG: hypothetical protein C4546_02055 [Candidatus Parcubacteria bacterium]